MLYGRIQWDVLGWDRMTWNGIYLAMSKGIQLASMGWELVWDRIY